MQNNYYCSQKWWWLTVDPERKLLASCCKSAHQPIDTTWLKQNPGKLFNNPAIVQDRQDMLNNIPVQSCAKTCWIPESQGIPTRRTMLQDASDEKYEGTHAVPRVLEINLGSDCNMACVYCSKRFSTAWLRDISNGGGYITNYNKDDRYSITKEDQVILKLGQSVIKTSNGYQLIINEIKKFGKVNTLKFAGGEPFLYNGLEDVVQLVEANSIEITTGLGVNNKRFERIVQILPKTTTLVISAESLNETYEFVRNGNTFANFLQNLEIIKKYNINYKFAYALSNVNIHGFKQFQDEFATDSDYFNILVDPAFLSPVILDTESKQRILDTNYKWHEKEIHQAVSANYTDEQYNHFREFIIEFSKRRNLTLDVFPESFVKWIQQ